MAAEACVIVADPTAAAGLYRDIQLRCPDARFFWGGIGAAFAVGPVPRLLGELALVTGEVDAARRHLEDAVALRRSIAARPFLALSLAALARCPGASRGEP